MANKYETNCLSCHEIFVADVRQRGRQKYCPKPECRRTAKAARQARWLSKAENSEYFRCATNAARVRRWQQTHRGYWRNTTRYQRHTLQDAIRSQVLDSAANRGSALQDAFGSQGTLHSPLLIGLIAHLTDSTLQDDIVATARRLAELGRDVLAGRAQTMPAMGVSTS
jgi:hypothetical protein